MLFPKKFNFLWACKRNCVCINLQIQDEVIYYQKNPQTDIFNVTFHYYRIIRIVIYLLSLSYG